MNFVDIYQKYWKNGYTLTDLSLSGIDREMFRSLFNPVAEVFRKYPAGDVHLYIPGVGQVNGLQPDNYFDSAGTTLASVDDSVGLVLDAAGSVGAELLTSGTVGAAVGAPGSLPTGWQGGITINGITRQVVNVGADFIDLRLTGTSTSTWADFLGVIGTTVPVTPGQTFRFALPTDTVVGGVMPAGGSISYGAVFQLSGTFVSQVAMQNGVVTVPAGVNQLRLFNSIANYSSGAVVDVTIRVPASASCKQITGIHATQSTPGYKPTLRRGIVNLLTYSNDLTNAVWVKTGASTPTANSVSLPADYVGNVRQSKASVQTGVPITAAFLLSGTPGVQVSLSVYDEGGSYGNDNVTVVLSTTPTVYVVTRSNPQQTTVSARITAYGTATTVTVGGTGLFQGTLTAAQILAAGGIPLTTTAPASSQAGVNYAEFDGVDDRLNISNTPWSGADDFAVVVAFRANQTGGNNRTIFSVHNNSVSATTFFPLVGADGASGKLRVLLANDANVNQVYFSPSPIIGLDVVVSLRRVGAALYVRHNGVDVATLSVPGTYTTTEAGISFTRWTNILTDFFNGRLYDLIPIKGTLTLADVQLLEKQAAAAAGIQL